MVSLNFEDIKIISLENIIEFSKFSGNKEIKKILEKFDNNDKRFKLSESYKLQNKLEKIIQDYVKEITEERSQKFEFNFNRQYVGFDSPDLIPKEEPNIEYVSQTFLDYLGGNGSWESRVLGAYDPRTNTIYILNTLYGREHNKTLHHEKEHWLDPAASETEIRRRTAMAGYF